MGVVDELRARLPHGRVVTDDATREAYAHDDTGWAPYDSRPPSAGRTPVPTERPGFDQVRRARDR